MKFDFYFPICRNSNIMVLYYNIGFIAIIVIVKLYPFERTLKPKT